MNTPRQIVKYLESYDSHSWSNLKKTQEMIKEAKELLALPYGTDLHHLTIWKELLEGLCDHYRVAGICEGQDHARENG
jgi:hypothetical protein